MIAKDYKERGNQHYEEQQFEEALSDYSKAIELNPQYADAYNNRGIVLKDLGRQEEALRDYNKAIELKPQEFNTFYNRGNLLLDLRRQEEALSDYSKAIELNPQYADAYNSRGIVLRDLGRQEEALRDYNKAIELKPQEFNAFYNRGNLLRDLGRKKKALRDFNKVIELNPQYANVYNNRGNLLLDLRRQEEALTDYSKSIKLNPQSFFAFYNRGNLLRDLGRNEEALRDYSKAIELNPQNAALWYAKGFVYLNEEKLLESQRQQTAQRYFLRALLLEIHPIILKIYLQIYQSYPKHPFFLQYLFRQIVTQVKLGIGAQEQVANTCRYINLYLNYLKTTIAPSELETVQWHQFIALINYFMGDPAMAFQMLKRILIANPYNLQAHYYLINSCYEFLENEEPYLETALAIAEQVYQTLQTDKQQSIQESSINQRYYAALIFTMDTEYQLGIDCIKDIWDQVDYLPISYLYYWLLFALQKEQLETDRRQSALETLTTKKDQYVDGEYEAQKEKVLYDEYWSEEDSLTVLKQDPFPRIAKYILRKEKKEHREKYFAYGFPVHNIDPKREKWWEPFYHYAHYEEIASAISLLQLQASKHFNDKKIVPGHSLPDFWDCFKIEGIDIIQMKSTILQKERERYGQLFLDSAKTQLKQVAEPISRDQEDLKKAINHVLYEGENRNLDTKRVFENFEERLNKTTNSLINDIIDHIEAQELNGDIATYHYLISYFYLSNNLSEQDCIMLQLYAIYAKAFEKKELTEITQEGLKSQFEDMFENSYDLATSLTSITNPVLGLTISSLKPLAKGSMGELFVSLIKNRSHDVMMSYSVDTYDVAPYNKMLLAPSFKSAFVEFVGEEKERLGDRFDTVYPLYGFEEWFE